MAQKDQLAAKARDAGHAAKDDVGYAAMSETAKPFFDNGVHSARELIRSGITKEMAQQIRLQADGMQRTLAAFIEGTVPSKEWSE